MKFKYYLNEVKAIEGNRVLFSLPTDTKSYDTELKIVSGHEVLECIRYFISHYPDKFVLEDRQKNRECLQYLSIPFSRTSYVPFIFDEIIPYLKPEYFNRDKSKRLSRSIKARNADSCKDDCYAYVFIIKNPYNIFPCLRGYKFKKLYIRFDFLYRIEIDPKSKSNRYISPYRNKYSDLVIDPQLLTLSEISLHF